MRNDFRYLRTDRHLKDALFSLIKKHSINKITISEICELAECNRNTFYLHYEDKYNLMDAVSNDFLTDCFSDPKLTNNKKMVSDFYEETNIVFTFLKEHSNTVKLLEKNDPLFFKKFKQRLEEKTLSAIKNTTEVPIDENILLSVNYLVHGLSGCFFDECMKEHCSENVSSLLTDFSQSIMNFVQQTIKKNERT